MLNQTRCGGIRKETQMKKTLATLASTLLCALISANAATVVTTTGTQTVSSFGSSTDNTTALGIGENSITPKSILDVNNTNTTFVTTNFVVGGSNNASNSVQADQRFINNA